MSKPATDKKPKPPQAGCAVVPSKNHGKKRPATIREQMRPPDSDWHEWHLSVPAMPDKNLNAGRLAVAAPFATVGAIAPLQRNLAGEDATPEAIMFSLIEQIRMVRADNLSEIEAMLVSQAVGLQTQWASLSRRAVHQEMLPHYQAFMNLALRAQAQSRATLEALIELKRPRHPPTFVRQVQANIANGGPQQVVNNGPEPSHNCTEPSRTDTSEIAPTKLLDAQPSTTLTTGGVDERLDSRAPCPAGRADKAVGTLE